MKEKISTLWIVVMLNMAFADILSFIKPEFLNELLTGKAGGIEITPTLLVVSAVFLEIPILMIFLSRFLPTKSNKIANYIAVALTTLFIIGGGSLSPHYIFIASVELICMGMIVYWSTCLSPKVT